MVKEYFKNLDGEDYLWFLGVGFVIWIVIKAGILGVLTAALGGAAYMILGLAAMAGVAFLVTKFGKTR